MRSCRQVLLVVLCLYSGYTRAQIGVNVRNPNPYALLELKGADKGFLAPQIRLVQASSPAPIAAGGNIKYGMWVYNTNADTSGNGLKGKGYYYWDSTDVGAGKWSLVYTTTNLPVTNWQLTGNPGTRSTVNFLGTTDDASLRIRTSNTERMVVDSLGYVGVGTAAPRVKFQVDGGSVLFGADTASAGSRMVWNMVKGALRTGGVATPAYWNASNIGAYSFAAGFDTRATGTYAVAMGDSTLASGNASFAGGTGSVAGGNNAAAFGSATASGNMSFAAGNGAKALGAYSSAFGSSTAGSPTNGKLTFAAGAANQALANYSTAVGQNNIVDSTATVSFASGYNNRVYAPNSAAIGSSNTITNPKGGNTSQNSVAFGSSNTTTGNGASAFGSTNKANASYSTAMGLGNTIDTASTYSTVTGSSNIIANSTGAFIAGQSNYIGSAGSPTDTSKIANYSIAMGTGNNITKGNSSVILGQSNSITGSYSAVIGHYSSALADHATAIGGFALVNQGHNGSMVLTGNSLGGAGSSAPSQFTAAFSGGYRFFTNQNLTRKGLFITDSIPGYATALKVGINNPSPAASLHVTGNTIIDNGTTAGAVQIKDGTEGAGKVLTSDANGVATWKAAATQYTILGVVPASQAMAISASNTTFYTGCYIDLPAGQWNVTATVWLEAQGSALITPSYMNPGFFSFFYSTSSTAVSPPAYASNIKSIVIPPPRHGASPSIEGLGTGSIPITITGGTQRIYLWGYGYPGLWNSLPALPSASVASLVSWNNTAGSYGPYTQLYAVPIAY